MQKPHLSLCLLWEYSLCAVEWSERRVLQIKCQAGLEDKEVHQEYLQRQAAKPLRDWCCKKKKKCSQCWKVHRIHRKKQRLVIPPTGKCIFPAKQNKTYLGIVEITTQNFPPLCQQQTNQNNYLLPQPRKIYSLTVWQNVTELYPSLGITWQNPVSPKKPTGLFYIQCR